MRVHAFCADLTSVGTAICTLVAWRTRACRGTPALDPVSHCPLPVGRISPQERFFQSDGNAVYNLPIAACVGCDGGNAQGRCLVPASHLRC